MKAKFAGLFLLVLSFTTITLAYAQQSNTRDVTCTFADGHSMRVQYDAGEKASKQGLPVGQPWTPNHKPMLLFLDTDVTVGGTAVPLGAYSLFVIPGKENWSLVVNRDVQGNAKHDPSKDIARTTMPTGELGSAADDATVYLAHVGPKQCNVRVVYGKTMAWGETHEK